MSDSRIDALMGMLNGMGVKVVETSKLPAELRGAYSHAKRRVYVRPGLTSTMLAATLAHELIHAEYGHEGHQDPAVERRVDERAAMLLVSPVAYAAAEGVCGAHAGALAKELEVPVWVVEAWRRVVQRSFIGVG